MRRKCYPPEKIIGMLREAEVVLSQGLAVGQICRQVSISAPTYYRWRRQYGGLTISQAKRMKDIACENVRLEKAVVDLTLAKVILKEALQGNYQAPTGAVSISSICKASWGYPKGGSAG